MTVHFAAIALAANPDLPLGRVGAGTCCWRSIEPIEWKLLTTVAVNTAGDALESMQ